MLCHIHRDVQRQGEAVVEASLCMSSSLCMAQLVRQVGAVKAMNIKDKLFKKAGICLGIGPSQIHHLCFRQG